jgi:hypothetical protein
VTKEMLEDQQKKIKLIQRLLSVPEAELETVVEQEKDQFDLTFSRKFPPDAIGGCTERPGITANIGTGRKSPVRENRGRQATLPIFPRNPASD